MPRAHSVRIAATSSACASVVLVSRTNDFTTARVVGTSTPRCTSADLRYAFSFAARALVPRGFSSASIWVARSVRGICVISAPIEGVYPPRSRRGSTQHAILARHRLGRPCAAAQYGSMRVLAISWVVVVACGVELGEPPDVDDDDRDGKSDD